MALIVLVLAVYAGTLDADFVRWDDPDHVADNPRVTANDGLRRAWQETGSPGFYPITYATWWAEWRLAKGKPWLFHLDNALLHGANAALVAALGSALGLGPIPSFFAAAVWALHPMQAASVAWVTERKNVLSVFLWLLALHAYLWSTTRPRFERAAAYVGALVLFAAALVSKGAAMTLPAVIVLVEWARGRAHGWRFWLGVVPFVALAVGGGLGLVSAVPEGMKKPGLWARLTLAPWAFWYYASKFFWPVGLVPIYPRWPLGTLGTSGVVLVAGMGAAGAAVLVLWRRLPRAVLVGAGLFVVNVVPVAGLVWFTWYELAYVSDHLAYLPTLGLALATVAGVDGLVRTRAWSWRIPGIALGAWCAVLAVTTWRYAGAWHDTQTLWTYTLARNPRCVLCHYNRGVMLEEAGDFAAAAAEYEQAVAIEPDPWTLLNLGNLRLLAGKPEEALALYRRAAELEPGNEKIFYDMGLVLRQLGRHAEALAGFARAAALLPDWGAAHRAVGEELLEAGKLREAAFEFQRTLLLEPDDAGAERGLAHVAATAGNWTAAVPHFERALEVDGESLAAALTHRELALALDQLERGDEALAHYRAAQRLAPDDPESAVVLASALFAREMTADGVAVLEEAVRRLPDAATVAGLLAWVRATNPDAHWRDAAAAVRLAEHACALTDNADADQLDTLAAAYAEAGRYADAVRTARRALEVGGPDAPQAEDVRRRLAFYEAGRPYRE